MIIRVSLWAPPTVSTSKMGFKPRNAAADLAQPPRRAAARAVNQTAPRLASTAAPFAAHSAPARLSGVVA